MASSPIINSGFGNNRLATGFTLERTKSKLKEAQDQLSRALQEAGELQALQIETKEKVTGAKHFLKDIERLLAQYNAEIEHRANRIDECEASSVRTRSQIAQLEARLEWWGDRRAKPQDNAVDLAVAQSEAVFDTMTRISDDEYQNLLQRIASARAAKLSSATIDAIANANAAASSTDDSADDVSSVRTSPAIEAAVVAEAEPAASDPPRQKRKADQTAATETSASSPPASKKQKNSHLPEKYRNLPRLSYNMRQQFKAEGRCFGCHEVGHRKSDSKCPLFNYSVVDPSTRKVDRSKEHEIPPIFSSET
jgi:hypothetical protein